MSLATGPMAPDRSRRIRVGRGIEDGISLYGAAVFLTALTLIPHLSLSAKGASRWLLLGPLSLPRASPVAA